MDKILRFVWNKNERNAITEIGKGCVAGCRCVCMYSHMLSCIVQIGHTIKVRGLLKRTNTYKIQNTFTDLKYDNLKVFERFSILQGNANENRYLKLFKYPLGYFNQHFWDYLTYDSKQINSGEFIDPQFTVILIIIVVNFICFMAIYLLITRGHHVYS